MIKTRILITVMSNYNGYEFIIEASTKKLLWCGTVPSYFYSYYRYSTIGNIFIAVNIKIRIIKFIKCTHSYHLLGTSRNSSFTREWENPKRNFNFLILKARLEKLII